MNLTRLSPPLQPSTLPVPTRLVAKDASRHARTLRSKSYRGKSDASIHHPRPISTGVANLPALSRPRETCVYIPGSSISAVSMYFYSFLCMTGRGLQADCSQHQIAPDIPCISVCDRRFSRDNCPSSISASSLGCTPPRSLRSHTTDSLSGSRDRLHLSLFQDLRPQSSLGLYHETKFAATPLVLHRFQW